MDDLWSEFCSRFWEICLLEFQKLSVKRLVALLLVTTVFVHLSCMIYAKSKKHSIFLSTEIMIVLLVSYIGFIAQVTFFNRGYASQARVFDTKWLWIDSSMDQNITNLLNIILFVPFGFLLAGIQRYKKNIKKMIMVLNICFLTSLSVECSQYMTRRGYFEIDDIQANILGGLIGGIFFSLCLIIGRFVHRKYMEEVLK